MKKLEISQMENLQGGASTATGYWCGAAVSGAFFGGISLVLSAAMFGPTCIGRLIKNM